MIYTFFYKCFGDHLDLHSFPTRRSSDLHGAHGRPHRRAQGRQDRGVRQPRDRKSTRLNSSHSQISYAVFCLKKKSVATLMIHTLTTISMFVFLSMLRLMIVFIHI